jgi:hypothetical protein
MGSEFQKAVEREIREIQREVIEALGRELEELLQSGRLTGLSGFFPPDTKDEA